MKHLKRYILLCCLGQSLLVLGAEPAGDQPPDQSSGAKPDTNNIAEPQNAPASAAVQPDTTAVAPDSGSDSSTNGLRLNFRGAPLGLVLDYLSDAAGFIINKEADVKGTVDVWSKEPVSKEDAVKLLNSVLRKNGYAVTRDGRILTIVSLESAKTSDLDILQGDKWEDLEKSDEVVTQIIPVRYANATQLMNNLQQLLPTSASLSVNESANSLILVATKTDIRRMLKIVAALDTSIASVTTIKVFPLRYADAKQLATVIQQLFTQPTGQNNVGNNPRAQFFNMMRGGPFGGPGGAGGGQANSGNAAGAKVTAAADDYSNSLIVSASTELMATISDMVKEIDQPASDVTELRVFHLLNADPTELADQFAQLFPDDTRTGTGQNQGGGGGGFRFFGGRGGGNNQASTSDRMKKKSRVLAVADPRTSSLLVSAASEMMPQIAEMIAQLDSSPARHDVVKVFDLQNADPQDVNQVLQDLFNKNNTMRQNNNNSRSMLGQGNPLTQRQTQQQIGTGTSSSLGSTRGGSGMATGF